MNKINKYSVIGVMSGTSLDGLDIIKCSFTKNDKWQYIIEKGTTIKYSEKWIKTLRTIHQKPLKKINEISIKYGTFIGEEINKFIKKNEFNVDFIASHGHTIFHQPEKKYTLQIGDGETISNTTNKLTISNFRKLDVKLNGQGAPLVPIGDIHLFSNYKYCLNLGGFANISIQEKSNITAFDICPVNIILNHLSNRLDMEFDKNGNLGKEGACNIKLLKKLNKLRFYNQKEPKSLSREWLEENILSLTEIKEIKTKDILATFYEHIGFQIGKLLRNKTTLVSGGGAYNKFLCSKIKKYAKSEIIIATEEIINFKEALIFGFLGVLRIRNEVNCLKDVTGALRDNCGGEINRPYLTK
tara:strand:- start:2566 stop:3633 length:1068 start_codon:yes stop_codon:yes gene_type:complete